MTEISNESKTSRVSQMEPLVFGNEHEIQVVRDLSLKETKDRAMSALSYLHKGRPEVARLVRLRNSPPGLRLQRGCTMGHYGQRFSPM